MALGLPVIAVFWMTATGVFERYREVVELREVETLSRLSVQIGSLVHQLQFERGVSYVYLGSGGSAFHEQLRAARAATDERTDELQKYLRQNDLTLPGSRPDLKGLSDPQDVLPVGITEMQERFEKASSGSLRHYLVDILQKLRSLPEVRQRIDELDISGQRAMEYYTEANWRMNDLIARLAHHSPQPAINRQLAAYYNLMMYKDLAGQERAITTLVLYDGLFTAAHRLDLLQVWGEQRAFYTNFRRLSDTQHGNLLADSLEHDSNPARAALRRILQEHAGRGEPLLDGNSVEFPLPNWETWHVWQTDYIDQIKVVADTLANAIINQAEVQRQSAAFTLWRYLVISPLSVLTALILIYLIIRSTRLRLKLAETIFNHTDDGITVTDHQANIIDSNQAFTRITGYPREEVKGKNPRLLQSGRHGPEFYRRMWKQLTEVGAWHGEIWNRRKNGEPYSELLTINAVRDKSGKATNYIAIFSDITDQANRQQQQLEQVAHYDLLTGLPNRTLLVDRLRHALRSAHRDQHSVTIALINLDDFKQINDRHGHTIGDSVLEIMAQRFRAILRDEDTLARMGGDEFAIIIERTAAIHEAMTILERVHQASADPINTHGITLACSISIGVTSFPLDSGEAETLLRHAHHALHQSKLNGRNRIHFFDLHDAEKQSALSRLVQRLEGALVNDELVLHYQPKVDMANGKLLGAEALLRWEDPEHGMVPPGEFLPYIEHHPIVIKIGQWVIETALNQMVEWQRQGASIRVSVNVSARELHHPKFLENLRACLAAQPELKSDMLELEILESAAVDDIQRASRVLNECRSQGVSIALDDFGTGYASLSYLKLLPADCLKIDQTFVRDMLSVSGDRMIAKAIISLADAFGFDVVAEGIEEEAQGLALIEMGCFQGQGFGIGRPMPAQAILPWWRDWQNFPSWEKPGQSK